MIYTKKVTHVWPSTDFPKRTSKTQVLQETCFSGTLKTQRQNAFLFKGGRSNVPKRRFKTHKTQETTATVVKTPSERMTQNANSANFQNASFAKRGFAKRGSEFQNAVLNPLRLE